MKNHANELKALLNEFCNKPFAELSHFMNADEAMLKLLKKFGIDQVSFDIEELGTNERGAKEYLLFFSQFDIRAKLVIKAEDSKRMFLDSDRYHYSFISYEGKIDKKKRFISLINSHRGVGEEFADEYDYLTPTQAIRQLLDNNQFEDVEFELKEVRHTQIGGCVDAEYLVTFQEFEIPVTLLIYTMVQDGDNVYLYLFSEEEAEEALQMGGETEFNLSFQTAIERCLNGVGFIRGNDFGEGFYVRNERNVLVVIDGKNNHQISDNFKISKGCLQQKYKLFSIASRDEIGLEGSENV